MEGSSAEPEVVRASQRQSVPNCRGEAELEAKAPPEMRGRDTWDVLCSTIIS